MRSASTAVVSSVPESHAARTPSGEILLVVPPFQETTRPALGVSLLKTLLQERGFNAKIHYLNFRFAEKIGLHLYEWISSHTFDSLLGEFLCSHALFQRSPEELEQYVKQVLAGSDVEQNLPQWFSGKSIEQILRQLIDQTSTFYDEAVDEILDHKPWLVGFTSSYQQNCASVALMRRVKQRRPDILTVMGGANCQTEMGEELFHQFPEIDFVAQGESDHSFVELVQQLRSGDRNTSPQVPGILSRSSDQLLQSVQPFTGEDLDRLPVPDFNDYYTALSNTSVGPRIRPSLLMETSRGCWWGAKQHCTFCGLNGMEMGFRSKSPERALGELTELVDRYGTAHVSMVDNILDMKYFQTVLPKLAERPVVEIFYETKSNLTKPQVELLARSKTGFINPGIESFSDRTLQLMRKGTSKVQNIQLLKWCAEFGIFVGWNYLYGFPGEDEEELSDLACDFEAVSHLQPPTGPSSIRMDRFSPYFTAPAAYGLEPTYPAEPYRHIYPFPGESLRRIAYFYQCDAFTSASKSNAFQTCQAIISAWQRGYTRSYLLAIHRQKSLLIIDTRRCRQRFWHRLVGLRRTVYEFCDRAHTVSQIREAVGAGHEDELDNALEWFVRAKLMLYSNGRYLSLAVNAGPNCGKIGKLPAGGYVLRDSRFKRYWQSFGRFAKLEISPGKLFRTASRIASFAKRRCLSRTIFHLTKILSD